MALHSCDNVLIDTALLYAQLRIQVMLEEQVEACLQTGGLDGRVDSIGFHDLVVVNAIVVDDQSWDGGIGFIVQMGIAQFTIRSVWKDHCLISVIDIVILRNEENNIARIDSCEDIKLR